MTSAKLAEFFYPLPVPPLEPTVYPTHATYQYFRLLFHCPTHATINTLVCIKPLPPSPLERRAQTSYMEAPFHLFFTIWPMASSGTSERNLSAAAKAAKAANFEKEGRGYT